jgi:hypothetical protein
MLAQSASNSERCKRLWQDDNFRNKVKNGTHKSEKNARAHSKKARAARTTELWRNEEYRKNVTEAVSRTRVPVIFTPEVRRKLSEATTRAMTEGRLRHTGKRTLIKSKKGGIFLTKSSWETAYARQLELDCKVLQFKYEPLRIPYYYEDRLHYYVPDFWVRYGDREEIIEIKPSRLINYPVNVAKIKAASDQDIIIRIITEVELKL